MRNSLWQQTKHEFFTGISVYLAAEIVKVSWCIWNPLHLQFLWRVDKKYVPECVPALVSSLFMLATDWWSYWRRAGWVSNRARERSAISQLSGDFQEKEKCSSGCGVQSAFITLISHTHSSVGCFGVEQCNKQPSQMLRSTVGRTPESEKERRELETIISWFTAWSN